MDRYNVHPNPSAPGTPGPGVPHDRKGRIRFQVMAAKVFRREPLRDPSHHRR